MIYRISLTFVIVVSSLAGNNFREISGTVLDDLIDKNSYFDDVDADFDVSKRSKLLVKNKRLDNGGDGVGRESGLALDDEALWPGRWLPDKVETKHRVVSKRLNDTGRTNSLAMMTGSLDPQCDDGKTNLTVDWSGSPENHTCFRRSFFVPDPNMAAFIMHDYIPTEYHARHVCMKDKIEYDTLLPTFGPHRPAWPRYGEYTFLPVQRWLHSLEHGAIVMLYHPCTHPIFVSRLRDIVTSCLYRHIITPYTLLSKERPLAILSWGWAMTMSEPDEDNVVRFIKEHARRGPEQLSDDGVYDLMLKKPAEIITNIYDENVCPNSIQHVM